MKSKSKIFEQMKRKTNPELARTILESKKNDKWLEVSSLISTPRSKRAVVNLDRIEKNSKEGDTIVVPGKVLGKGDISKKIRIAALGFSKEAIEKLKSRKCEIVKIIDEIKINPKFQGVKIIK